MSEQHQATVLALRQTQDSLACCFSVEDRSMRLPSCLPWHARFRGCSSTVSMFRATPRLLSRLTLSQTRAPEASARLPKREATGPETAAGSTGLRPRGSRASGPVRPAGPASWPKRVTSERARKGQSGRQGAAGDRHMQPRVSGAEDVQQGTRSGMQRPRRQSRASLQHSSSCFAT